MLFSETTLEKEAFMQQVNTQSLSFLYLRQQTRMLLGVGSDSYTRFLNLIPVECVCSLFGQALCQVIPQRTLVLLLWSLTSALFPSRVIPCGAFQINYKQLFALQTSHIPDKLWAIISGSNSDFFFFFFFFFFPLGLPPLFFFPSLSLSLSNRSGRTAVVTCDSVKRIA